MVVGIWENIERIWKNLKEYWWIIDQFSECLWGVWHRHRGTSGMVSHHPWPWGAHLLQRLFSLPHSFPVKTWAQLNFYFQIPFLRIFMFLIPSPFVPNPNLLSYFLAITISGTNYFHSDLCFSVYNNDMPVSLWVWNIVQLSVYPFILLSVHPSIIKLLQLGHWLWVWSEKINLFL